MLICVLSNSFVVYLQLGPLWVVCFCVRCDDCFGWCIVLIDLLVLFCVVLYFGVFPLVVFVVRLVCVLGCLCVC